MQNFYFKVEVRDARTFALTENIQMLGSILGNGDRIVQVCRHLIQSILVPTHDPNSDSSIAGPIE